MLVSIEARILV